MVKVVENSLINTIKIGIHKIFYFWYFLSILLNSREIGKTTTFIQGLKSIIQKRTYLLERRLQLKIFINISIKILLMLDWKLFISCCNYNRQRLVKFNP